MSSLKKVTEKSLKFARVAGSVIGFIIMVLFEFSKVMFKMATSTNGAHGASPPASAPTSPKAPETKTEPIPTASAYAGIVSPEDKSALNLEPMHSCDQFSGSSSFRSFQKDGQTVDMRLHLGDSARIESVLKVPCERLHWMRSKTDVSKRLALATFTPLIATQLGLPFNFDGAQKFISSSASLKAIAATEQKHVSASPLDHVSSIPHTRLNESAGSESEGVSVEVIGTVVSAGQSKVSPKGKLPYTTFTVILLTSAGEVSMSGVELKEKFEDNSYGIGDYISVKKTRVEYKVDEKNRTKNSYAVTMLKRASN